MHMPIHIISHYGTHNLPYIPPIVHYKRNIPNPLPSLQIPTNNKRRGGPSTKRKKTESGRYHEARKYAELKSKDMYAHCGEKLKK